MKLFIIIQHNRTHIINWKVTKLYDTKREQR